jgi:hypothetical protein
MQAGDPVSVFNIGIDEPQLRSFQAAARAVGLYVLRAGNFIVQKTEGSDTRRTQRVCERVGVVTEVYWDEDTFMSNLGTKKGPRVNSDSEVITVDR